mgnify:CR=1 FL=1
MPLYDCEVQETMCYMVQVEAADKDAAHEGAVAFLDDLQGIRAACEIHVDVQEVR